MLYLSYDCLHCSRLGASSDYEKDVGVVLDVHGSGDDFS
jgi:hypothetical protein